MYGRFEKSRQLKIPDTIDQDEVVYGVFCLPNNPEWIAIARGLFGMLSRGRFWQRDDREDSIRHAQSVGKAIGDSLMICNLEEKLDAIVTAINSQRLTVSPACCTELTPPSPPNGGDYGEFPVAPPSGDYPIPEWDTESPTYDDHLCLLFNAFYTNLYELVAFVESLDWILLSATAIVGVLAVIFPEPITTVLGTVTLASVAGALAAAVLWQEAIEETFAQLKITMKEHGAGWLCEARELETLQETLIDFAERFKAEAVAIAGQNGVPEWVINAVLGIYNTGEYAATWLMQWHLGYLADIGTAPDGGIACECPDGCLECIDGFRLVEMNAGQLVTVTPRPLYDSSCTVQINDGQFNVSGVTATSGNYSEYWISMDMLWNMPESGLCRGLLFDFTAVDGTNSLRIDSYEAGQALQNPNRVIFPESGDARIALVDCWTAWNGAYFTVEFAGGGNLLISSGAIGGQNVSASFRVFMIYEDC